jgi:Ca2+-binding RTX toxin-like protein
VFERPDSGKLVPLVLISTRGPPVPGGAYQFASPAGPTHIPVKVLAMFRKRSRHFAFESLESRELLAADANLAGDVLNIRGTNRADVIDVQRLASGPDAGMVQVTLNGQQKLFSDNYTGSGIGSISQIAIRGRGGADQISIAGNIYIPAVITGNRGNDTIVSGAGNDMILGGRGSDTILGSDGVDSIDGGRGNDQIEAGGGSDTCVGGKGNDTILGNEDDDFLDGGRGRDLIEGGEGDDTCAGGVGNDFLNGGRGKDELNGDAGNDDLYGESGKDVLFGQLGNDRLDGGDSNDHLDGGLGNDNVLGGAGDDQLKGGLGIDALDGQEGLNLLDNELETEIVLNGLVVDLDREFLLDFAGAGPGSFAKFDLQNINGQVVEKLTVQAHGLAGQTSFDLLLDGQTAVQVPVDVNGDASVEYSSDPSGSQLAFPLNFPLLGSNSTVGGSSGLGGTVVRKFVI